jgi:hypothetical protein
MAFARCRPNRARPNVILQTFSLQGAGSQLGGFHS